MKLHKNWNNITLTKIKEKNDASLNSLRRVADLFNIKDKWELEKLTPIFISEKKPSAKYENHLQMLSSSWIKNDGFYY